MNGLIMWIMLHLGFEDPEPTAEHGGYPITGG